MKHLFFVIFVVALLSYACKEKPLTPSGLTLSANTVMIGCEGNYTWGNATTSIYFKSNDSVWDDAYAKQNSEALGDVLQSMSHINGRIFLVMNNSNTVIICNEKTLKKEGEIIGLTSPRYIADNHHGEYYVSDLYANSIALIDQNTLQKVSSIPCVGWSENMLFKDDKMYITNPKSAYLYIVDCINNQPIDSLNIGYGSNDIVQDKFGHIWISTAGNTSLSIPASILCLQAASAHPTILKTFNFGLNAPKELCINKQADQLLYVQTSVYKMSVEASVLPSTPFISAAAMNIYAMALDPSNDDVYLSDAKDYVQRGSVAVYSISGQAKHQFLSGIIPGSFLFFSN